MSNSSFLALIVLASTLAAKADSQSPAVTGETERAAGGFDLVGPCGFAGRGAELAEDEGAWAYGALINRALTIGGGTSEIQKNIIAERVLGLPKGT